MIERDWDGHIRGETGAGKSNCFPMILRQLAAGHGITIYESRNSPDFEVLDDEVHSALSGLSADEVTDAVLKFLRREFGYRHVPDGIDWCVWEREQDFSQVTLGPCEPITENRYAVDWRRGEGRDDVPVVIHEPAVES